MIDRLRVMGIDPGFANFGWAVVELCATKGPHVALAGVIRTEKEAKKQNTYAAHDNIRRAREIASTLGELIEAFEVRALCVESMSFPRNASVAAQMAMSWGVIATYADRFRLPIVSISPQAIKLAVAASKSASKDDVARGVTARMTGVSKEVAHVPESKREHCYDAAASVLAARESDVICTLLQAYRG
jgi:Holliday junction resolvasome RuvABC endonuclease subunit